MIKDTITQIILKAEEGHYLTNGETFATTVVLPENADMTVWQEISEEEYNELTGKETAPKNEAVCEVNGDDTQTGGKV